MGLALQKCKNVDSMCEQLSSMYWHPCNLSVAVSWLVIVLPHICQARLCASRDTHAVSASCSKPTMLIASWHAVKILVGHCALGSDTP